MPASAHFPKCALSRGNCLLRTSESQGHWQIYDSSAAYRFEVSGMKSRLALQRLQIGSTSGCDGGRHGSDLGMTSVARHSEPGLTIAKSGGEATVCTPLTTSSRLLQDERQCYGFPLLTLQRLSRSELTQWPAA